MNPRTIYTCAAAAVLLAVIPAVYADNTAPEQPQTETFKIVYPDGKPAGDATLFLNLVDGSTNAITTTAYKADKSGIVHLTFGPHDVENTEHIVYSTSSTGVGFVDDEDGGAVSTVTLQPLTSIRIHFVDPSGKPAPHVTVSPVSFIDNLARPKIGTGWDARVPGDWTQTTDDLGNATFNNLPQGFYLIVSAAGDHYYISRDTAKPILLLKAATTPDATVTLTPAAAISGTVVDGKTNTPLAGIRVRASGIRGEGGAYTISDSNGHFIMGRLVRGRYYVGQRIASMMGVEAPSDWISDPQQVTIDSGGDVSGVVLRLFRGALITGKVTDTATGRPLADVPVIATPADGQAREVENDRRSTNTGADGVYSLHISPCVTTVTIQPEFKTTGALTQTQTDIKEGDVKTINFQVKAPALIQVLVLGPDGRPVPGASVTTRDAGFSGVRQDYTTDSKGCVTTDTDKLTPKSTIEAAAGNLGMATPVVYNGKPQIAVHLTAGSLCTVSGKVVAPAGKSLSLDFVTVMLLRVFPGEEEGFNYAQCDAKGNYSFPSMFGNATYTVQIQTDNYALSQTKEMTAKPGKTLQLPPLVLRPDNSFVGGLVLDSKGKPAVNCRVTDQDVMQAKYHSQVTETTDKSGRFLIKGVPTGKTTLSADGPMGTTVSLDATSGRKDNIIHLPPSPF